MKVSFIGAAIGVLVLAGSARAAPIQVVTPAPGATEPSDASFAAVAPAGTSRLVFFVDTYRIGAFDGPGYHALAIHLEQPGSRTFVARALDANGGIIDEQSVPFVASGLTLDPASGATADASDVRLEATPYALGTVDHVAFDADGYPVGVATASPWVVHRSFSQPGTRTLRARAYDASGQLLATATSVVQVVSPVDDLVPPADRGAISWYQGVNGPVKLNARTVAMLANASRWLAAKGGCDPARAAVDEIVQGSYHPGVGASAGTHDGGGVFDLSVSGLGHDERAALGQALREAGFAAWVRYPPAFPWHIHAVAIGDSDLSPAAEHQVHAYFRGLDGLADGAADGQGGPIVKSWMAPYE